MTMETADPDIWAFAIAIYQQPGVEAACLRLQNENGLSVALVLATIWRARQKRGFDPVPAAELAQDFERRVLGPVRTARHAMKSLPPAFDPAASSALRDRVKGLELDAERLVVCALDSKDFKVPPLSVKASLTALLASQHVALTPALEADLVCLTGAAGAV